MKKLFKLILASVMLTTQLSFFAGCNSGPDTLHEKYQDHFSVGFAMSYELLNSFDHEPLYPNFNSMTAENEMKWKYLRPNQVTTSYKKADGFIEKAKELGIGMRGHALVWHHTSAVPGYINASMSKESLITEIQKHVDETIKYFGDEVIYAWDVVNEAITDSNNSQTIYRTSSDSSGGASFFYDIAGEDYIFEAFRQAQKTVEENNLNIKLFYNDYGLNSPSKRARVIQMVKAIKAAGIRIDGVGMQGHYNLHTYKESEFRKAIQDFVDEGLEVQITELDISVHKDNNSNVKELTETLELAQARVYKSIFDVCMEFPEVTNITTWGLADDHTWLDNHPVANRKNWPLLFSETYQPKKAFLAVMGKKFE